MSTNQKREYGSLPLGTTVRIKKRLTTGHFNGSVEVVMPGMLEYAGKEATITGKDHYAHSYGVDVDGGYFNWPEETFVKSSIRIPKNKK